MVEFSLAGYRELIAAILARGYETKNFAEVEAGRPHLILRHDLDMSIDAALTIAEIEADLEIGASYFVLLRSEMYNSWSGQARDNLRRILDLGHEIGLHFDCSLYSSNLDDAAAEECRALEAVIGAPVETVSFHRPAKMLLGRAEDIAGRRHTYQPRYFSDMGYCSDSRGAWRHGHPLDHAALSEGRALQLLTHPIWWNRSEPLDPVQALDRLRTERDGVLAASLSVNCIPYREARGETPGYLKRDES